MDLCQKTVLVTGASRGIGRAVAKAFAAKGCRVAVGYCQNAQAAQKLVEELTAQGCTAMAVQADIAHSSQVEEMFRQIEAHLGAVDILVNNAGIAQQQLFTLITDEEWDRLFDVDVKGVFYCCRAALPHMIRQKSGRIINISSIWGLTGASCEVHYSAAKAAVIGLTKALAKEVGPSGITVNCVAPGVIATEMNAQLDDATMEALKEETPLEMIGTPEHVADSVVFLASSGGDFITGQVISPNGGIVI